RPIVVGNDDDVRLAPGGHRLELDVGDPAVPVAGTLVDRVDELGGPAGVVVEHARGRRSDRGVGGTEQRGASKDGGAQYGCGDADEAAAGQAIPPDNGGWAGACVDDCR